MAKRFFEYGEKEIRHLSRISPELGEAIERIGFIEREVEPDLFTALISSIVSQQISGRVAEVIWARLVKLVGEATPEKVSQFSIEELRSCGLSQRKAEYISGIAHSVTEGVLDMEMIKSLCDADFVRELTKFRGVGEWTAEMMLIFSLERPDVLSWGDLAIKKGVMKLYGLNSITREQFDVIKASFSPYNSVASLYIWEL